VDVSLKKATKELKDVFLSEKQIEQSIKRLNALSPFFGTVFLAFKEVDLPEGETKNLNFHSVLEAFLQKYYRLTNSYDGFYNPFKTSNKKKRWNTRQYLNTLHRTTIDMFSDVILHPKGSREWGWKRDYIISLGQEHLIINLIPAFDLAVWLFRTNEWTKDIQINDIIEAFFSEFHIEQEERVLFNTAVPFHSDPLLQEHPISVETLLAFVGYPPDQEVRNRPTNLPLFNRSNTLTEYGAKLQMLKLAEVGPAEETELDLTSRLNVITGDNALGKTFLLECAWWALTGSWASRYPALPRPNADNPSITFQISKEYQTDRTQTIKYNWKSQVWADLKNRDVLPGLSIFSQADGSFAIWDPAKFDNLLQPGDQTDAFMRISSKEIWDGVRETKNGKVIVRCRGLIEDWTTWQNAADQSLFNIFCSALKELSPHPQYPLKPGEPMRIPDEERDVRPVPTLEFPYGPVPIILCSAGIKRIVALAYLLVWAWNEHVVNSELIREKPQRSIVLLIDEMEAHLHPFWQRAIVPAVMKVVQALAEEVSTQIIIATHSPLILASMEPVFDEELDSLFHLYMDLDDGSVQLNQVPFVKRGNVDKWLMSDIFGLSQPRSIEAENAIETAKEVQLVDNPSGETVQQISNTLRRVLAPDDEFWPLWTYFAKQRGVRFDTSQKAT
jgi:hypothetical protein